MNPGDRIALITGGGGGVGRATALELSKLGATVCVTDLNEESLGTTVAAVESEGGRAIAMAGDVSDPATVSEWIERAAALCGRLDILVNNAGISHIKPFMKIDVEEWDKVFAVNTRSVFLGIQAAARVMIPQGSGRIINIASVAGRGGRPLLAAYAASKAAVINLTQSAAQALAQHKITCNSICPGVIATAMGASALSDIRKYTENGDVPASQSQVPAAPLGPEASPEDIARMVAYLAGPGGAYITGQAINIDGGRCMN